uniref:HCO3_cotransp domain-containing protein n=1 Tax=Mesocestoides corti TaxID=53468 RepID=A0A5K3EF53_MESCO
MVEGNSEGKPRSILKQDTKSPLLFTEISQLSYGEVPRGAIAITSSGSPPNTFWREVARYVLYEEVFDDDLKQFNTPQYPSISYQYFDRLCNIFNKDMKLLNSAAKTSESLMAEIANFAADDACLARANDAEALLTTLLAYRWHPQVNPRQGIYRLPRFSVTGPGRRISLVSRAEAVSDLTNKYLSVCLPRHSESCNIMIGRLKCLTKPLFLLVRILNEQTTNITGLVEVDVPLRFVLLLITPSSSEEKDLHQIGRCFASMLNDQKFLADLYRVQKPADLYQSAISFRKNMIVLSSGLPEVLNHSGGIDVPIAYYNEVYFERSDLVFEDYAADMSNRQFLDSDVGHKSGKMHFCSKHSFQRLWPPFNELVKGVKVFASRLPSDYTDAFTKDNVGTMLSSILFIYFVVFGPAITFGTLMINEVHPNYAISLNIFATGIFTVLYSLLAGQPLGSIGPSGPGFILETVIALFAAKMNADYQIYRFWVGVYMATFGILLIALNLSPLVTYARRSLEELFSGFISLFLILKALFSMFKVNSLTDYTYL